METFGSKPGSGLGDFEEALGPELLTKDGMKKTSDVLAGKKAVLVYFSAHWCSKCRGVTPVLAKAYKEYSGDDIEVVFASCDSDDKNFAEYYGEMPWTSLPHATSLFIASLSSKCGVQGIPSLAVLKPDGGLVKDDGLREVQKSGSLEEALKAWGL